MYISPKGVIKMPLQPRRGIFSFYSTDNILTLLQLIPLQEIANYEWADLDFRSKQPFSKREHFQL
ncbi:hypothetical protein DDR33_21190 [Pararcticibacter amylolyticus]|uniref:Uncharacterized protein n=1 Tax=Pararcticibacter amylolyticus TaxID=2173175 RepID=A0A2U2PB24_9SPHI|nr:hypothetical protein DDR33_21190 [Pararcticibacter amylolyticus]